MMPVAVTVLAELPMTVHGTVNRAALPPPQSWVTAVLADRAERSEDVTDPFDDPDQNYSVLLNAELQHSLWPSSATVPPGWRTVLWDSPRRDCLKFVSQAWTDMRPASLQSPLRDGFAEEADRECGFRASARAVGRDPVAAPV
jgi:MbtH protein